MVDLTMRSVGTLLCALFFGALATAAEQCNVEQVCSNLVVRVLWPLLPIEVKQQALS